MNAKTIIAASTALSLLLAPVAAAAQSASDLVGARAAGGESDLLRRGYASAGGSTKNGRKITYWWSASRKECLEVVTWNGRFDSVNSVGHSKCGKGDGGATAAAVAVGAAAVIGAIALSSGGNHHNRDQDYQRGYRDGQYGAAYAGNSRSYADGYNAGVQARQGQYSNNGYNNGGYYPGSGPLYGWYDDGWRRLEGRNTQEALNRLNSRGFAEVSNRKLGNEWVKEYWRRGTRECLVIRSAHNRINSIQPVHPDQCRY